MIQDIPIDELDDHPDNPRLIWREDVIDGIAAQLQEARHFDPAHALLVRLVNGRYQIVRGHHRKQAAVKVGFDTVPCWVREMDDDEAYMQLALGNVQGELSPLEIGVHALKAIELGERGRGKEGGLGQYADSIGKDRSHVSSYRNAAQVLMSTDSIKYGNVAIFLDKANHLASIHGASSELWAILVEWVTTPKDDKGNTPSAKQTQELVKAISKYDIPDEWQFFLPLADIVPAYIRDGKPTPEDVSQLVSAAEGIRQLIEGHSAHLDAERFTYTIEGFIEWLTDGIGSYAWNRWALQKYRQDVIAEAAGAQKPKPADAHLGEWYKLGSHRLYCGDTGTEAFWSGLPKATFAFADPPYNADNALWDSGFEWRHDWLIDKAEIVAVTPGISSIQEFFTYQTKMPYVWSMACWISNGMTRGAVGFGNWVYIALFSRGSVYRQSQDFFSVTIKTATTDQADHKGRKPHDLLLHLLGQFSESGKIVIDPFLGSGTTLFAADELNQVCYGGEIDPDSCNDIINRWQEKTGMQAEQIDGDKV